MIGRIHLGRYPRPPQWATHSVPEDGGVTHELVSDIHPFGFGWLPEAPTQPCEKDISLSVIDRPGPTGWVRAEPTVQIEGGKYTVAQARRLRQALDNLLARIDAA